MRTAEEQHLNRKIKELLSEAKESRIPAQIKPMPATLVDEPFDDPDWLYEVKWDGYRAVSYVEDGAKGVDLEKMLKKTQRIFSHEEH